MSELEDRAEELRAIAKACKTLNDFSAATGWNMETCGHARTVLSLDFPDAKLQAGKRTEARSVPKPQKAKPKA